MRNCHSAIRRRDVARALTNIPNARDLIPGVTADLLPAHRMYVANNSGGLQIMTDASGDPVLLEDGLQQGWPPAGAVCAGRDSES